MGLHELNYDIPMEKTPKFVIAFVMVPMWQPNGGNFGRRKK